MNTFLFTSHDRDNDPEVVKAKTRQDAIEILALARLSEEAIEQHREEGFDDLKVFNVALKSEIDYINQCYDVQPISVLTAAQVSKNNFEKKEYGKFYDDVRHAVGNL